jgi:hypothetical protein
MPPVPVQRPRFQPKNETMVLDDAEMMLELIEIAKSTTLKDPRRSPAAPTLSPDWLTELYSAASMTMDREECEAMAKEIALVHQPHPHRHAAA